MLTFGTEYQRWTPSANVYDTKQTLNILRANDAFKKGQRLFGLCILSLQCLKAFDLQSTSRTKRHHTAYIYLKKDFVSLAPLLSATWTTALFWAGFNLVNHSKLKSCLAIQLSVHSHKGLKLNTDYRCKCHRTRITSAPEAWTPRLKWAAFVNYTLAPLLLTAALLLSVTPSTALFGAGLLAKTNKPL